MKYSTLNTGMSTLLYVVPNLTRAINFLILNSTSNINIDKITRRYSFSNMGCQMKIIKMIQKILNLKIVEMDESYFQDSQNIIKVSV